LVLLVVPTSKLPALSNLALSVGVVDELVLEVKKRIALLDAVAAPVAPRTNPSPAPQTVCSEVEPDGLNITAGPDAPPISKSLLAENPDAPVRR
jgi:hypothetical protein